MAYDDEWRLSPEWQAVEKAVQDLLTKREDNIPNPMVADFVLGVAMLPSQIDSEWNGGYVFFCTNEMPHVGEGLASRGAAYFASLGDDPDEDD